MAKEKSGSGSVILRATLTQGAANGFIQSSMLTGLSSSGNDALVIKQITLEYPTLGHSVVAAFEMETAVTRASKAAMPNISDDDVLFKDKLGIYVGAASALHEKGVYVYVPDFEIVVIEDTIYSCFKSINAAAAGTVHVSIVAQPATVTESEKVGILLTRLN